MMQITTRHLLKFFPMKEEVREDFLAHMNELSHGQQLELNKQCWVLFYEIMQVEIDLEFENALEDVKDHKRKLRSDLYKQIQNQVYQRFLRDVREEQEMDALEDVRQKIQAIIAAKLKFKGKH